METRNWSKELRLGNYIMDSPVNGEEPLKVDAIYSNLVIHEETHIYNDEIRPIPLTDEWLNKFGFLCMNKRSLRFKIYIGKKTSDAIYVTLKTIGNNTEWYVSFNGFELRSIQYVHQLQNIYHSLCGEELEINLTQE